MPAHRLHIDDHGRLQGDAWITHNTPFPCVNGQGGITPPMRGAVMHTNAGTLPGTVAVFNHPGFNASAHFEIGGPWSSSEKDGRARIWQFGPARGWMAWHCMNGNADWWGIEHEDGGHPSRPLTDAQLTASAQVVEALSAQGGGWGFPLQVADSTEGHGLGAHYLGGQAWGGHTCPDLAPGGEGPRSHQRPEIIRRAKILREHGRYPAEHEPQQVTADGTQSLVELATAHQTPVSTALRYTVETGGLFSGGMSRYLQAGNLHAALPKGETLVISHPGGNLEAEHGGTVLTSPFGSLLTVSQARHDPVSTILRHTAAQLGVYGVEVSCYLQAGDLAAAPLPTGAQVVVPATSS